jgi:hypothetical protein
VKINESLPKVSRKIMRQKRVKHVLLYSCSRRVSLKVVLNLCHKIGFEVAKLPPQTRWRCPRYILSLSPAGLSGLGKARPCGPGARQLPCPGRPGRRPILAGSGGGCGNHQVPPPAAHTAVHIAVHTAAHTAVHTIVCTAGGEPAGSRSPPPTQF